MDVSKSIKIAASVLSVLGVVFVAAFFLEDRYLKNVAAKEMKDNIVARIVKVKEETSRQTLETFKDVQQSLQSMQQSNDLNRLESLRNEKYLMGKQLRIDPNNELLQERIERIQDMIEKLENKLYK